jgi:hypothetical protein
MPASCGCSARRKLQQLLPRLRLLDDAVADVGPVEAGDELLGLGQAEPLDDLVAGGGIGGGGERDARDARPALMQPVELHVFGAEVVPPLRDAVGLVDGEQRDGDAIEQGQEALGQQSLGGDVEQVEFIGQQRPFHPALLVRRQRRVEKGRAHAELAQRVDLILHQRDQRRDDDGGAVAQQRRDLITERLAAAGGHQHQRIAAAGDVLDDLLLGAAKVVAEDAAENVERGWRCSCHSSHSASLRPSRRNHGSVPPGGCNYQDNAR